MAGQLCRCKKPLRDAGGTTSLAARLFPFGGVGVGKKEVIDFCRNGAMPFTFHEKMRSIQLFVGAEAANIDVGVD